MEMSHKEGAVKIANECAKSGITEVVQAGAVVGLIYAVLAVCDQLEAAHGCDCWNKCQLCGKRRPPV